MLKGSNGVNFHPIIENCLSLINTTKIAEITIREYIGSCFLFEANS